MLCTLFIVINPNKCMQVHVGSFQNNESGHKFWILNSERNKTKNCFVPKIGRFGEDSRTPYGHAEAMKKKKIVLY